MKKLMYVVVWHISWFIWCIYWWTCRKYNNGIHWEITYPFFGWWRSRMLNLHADSHPEWTKQGKRWAWQHGGQSLLVRRLTKAAQQGNTHAH